MDPIANDPLTCLPAEIVLQILEFVPVSGLASLLRTSRAWKHFIDESNQDAIYSSPRKTESATSTSRDLASLKHENSFSRYFDGIATWKELCKRQTLLRRNWNAASPVTRESLLQLHGQRPVWRFRPDFKRRIFLATSHVGGLAVFDMDSGSLLWSLEADAVRPYAHLEYSEELGIACWDRFGDSIEVWKHDEQVRGRYRPIAILNHDCETRGFEFSHVCLCVVSSQGQAFVYDMTTVPPSLQTHMKIKEGALGHHDQNKDCIIFSLGSEGYHIHSKSTGELLGIWRPSHPAKLLHIDRPSPRPPPNFSHLLANSSSSMSEPFPSKDPRQDRLTPIHVRPGPYLNTDDEDSHFTLDEDDWGAAMIADDILVGISRGGRLAVCPNWRMCLAKPGQLDRSTLIVECGANDSTHFDLGGWLAVHNGRICLEIAAKIYIVPLECLISDSARPLYACDTSTALNDAVPVSFMCLTDDALLHTHVDLRREQWRNGIMFSSRLAAVKCIRILDFAPESREVLSLPEDLEHRDMT